MAAVTELATTRAPGGLSGAGATAGFSTTGSSL